MSSIPGEVQSKQRVFNRRIAISDPVQLCVARLVATSPTQRDDQAVPQAAAVRELKNPVVIVGYGRIGQNVGHALEEEGIPC